MIRYDGRFFRSVSSSETGEVSSETLFRYRQQGDVVWATYEGGSIRFGTLVALVDDEGALDMRYSHVNAAGTLMTGTCRSRPELLPGGRLRLHETWRWTSGDGSEGTSVVEEVDAIEVDAAEVDAAEVDAIEVDAVSPRPASTS